MCFIFPTIVGSQTFSHHFPIIFLAKTQFSHHFSIQTNVFQHFHKHFPIIFHRQGAPDGPCGLFSLVAGRGESQASGAAQCADPAARGAHGASATRMVRCQRKNRLG